MPITQLDPEPALIVVDLQKGIVGLPLVHPIAQTRKLHIAPAVDAMADMRTDAHDDSLAEVFPRLSETGTADRIVAPLSGR